MTAHHARNSALVPESAKEHVPAAPDWRDRSAEDVSSLVQGLAVVAIGPRLLLLLLLEIEKCVPR